MFERRYSVSAVSGAPRLLAGDRFPVAGLAVALRRTRRECRVVDQYFRGKCDVVYQFTGSGIVGHLLTIFYHHRFPPTGAGEGFGVRARARRSTQRHRDARDDARDAGASAFTRPRARASRRAFVRAHRRSHGADVRHRATVGSVFRSVGRSSRRVVASSSRARPRAEDRSRRAVRARVGALCRTRRRRRRSTARNHHPTMEIRRGSACRPDDAAKVSGHGVLGRTLRGSRVQWWTLKSARVLTKTRKTEI